MFELPDMEDLSSQMEDAFKEAQKAVDNLPGQLEGLDDVIGSLSSLMGNMPSISGDLTKAISGFSAQHQENSQSLVGDPDWGVEAAVKVGSILEVIIHGVFDLAKIKMTWESTQRGDFENIVSGVVSEADPGVDSVMMGQILGQLKQGRGAASVKGIQIVSCSIPGAPHNAADTLKLSPEGNIPLVMNEKGIGFELAPVLTIRNNWENAALPVFSPMGEKLAINPERFSDLNSFEESFSVSDQEYPIEVGFRFFPL